MSNFSNERNGDSANYTGMLKMRLFLSLFEEFIYSYFIVNKSYVVMYIQKKEFQIPKIDSFLH